MRGVVEERLSPLFYGVSLFFVATIVLGGINTNDVVASLILQYLSIPIIAVAIYRLFQGPVLPSSAHRALIFLCLGLLVPLMQLITLPRGLWGRLPYRELAGNGITLLGSTGGGPMSLAPFLTWTGYIALLPAMAIFLAVITFNTRERNSIVMVFTGMAILSAFLGLFQFSQNSSNGAYLYPEEPGDVVGFFANRNHFAALMYAAAPFAVAWILIALFPPQDPGGKEGRAAGLRSPAGRGSSKLHAFWDIIDWRLLFASAASFFVLVIACVMARSRAGVVLLMLALLAASFLPNWRKLPVADGEAIGGKALAALAGFSLLFALEYGFSRLLTRFEVDPLQDARVTIAKNTFSAALKALPTGTGLGTFQSIYSATERPGDVIPYVFVNHAHNDYLELLLEVGVPALVIIAAFLLWCLARARELWFSDATEPSTYLCRAASIAIGLLLLHSAVDYPLRTHALLGVFALCCALLLPSDRPFTTGGPA